MNWNFFSFGWYNATTVAKTLQYLVKTIGPVVAALWIGWQYYQSRVDKRVEATLGYVTRFEAEDTSIGKAQRALTEALWDHKDEIAEFRITHSTASELAEIQRTIALRVLSSAGVRLHRTGAIGPMEEVDEFFNGLATCVKGNVCDEASARRYFGCAVAGYLQSFEPILKERTELAPQFGWGLRWLSEKQSRNSQCWE
jgi:hypothetical protein